MPELSEQSPTGGNMDDEATGSAHQNYFVEKSLRLEKGRLVDITMITTDFSSDQVERKVVGKSSILTRLRRGQLGQNSEHRLSLALCEPSPAPASLGSQSCPSSGCPPSSSPSSQSVVSA